MSRVLKEGLSLGHPKVVMQAEIADITADTTSVNRKSPSTLDIQTNWPLIKEQAPGKGVKRCFKSSKFFYKQATVSKPGTADTSDLTMPCPSDPDISQGPPNCKSRNERQNDTN